MKKVNDPNAPENAVDWNRYYLRPGTTEPELRPEFANEAVEPEAVETTEKLVAEPKKAASKKASKKK